MRVQWWPENSTHYYLISIRKFILINCILINWKQNIHTYVQNVVGHRSNTHLKNIQYRIKLKCLSSCLNTKQYDTVVFSSIK